MIYYATFGYGQYGGALRNCYIELHAENEILVRNWMAENFNRIWASLYKDLSFTNVQGPYNRIAIVDIGIDAVDYNIKTVPTLE